MTKVGWNKMLLYILLEEEVEDIAFLMSLLELWITACFC